MLSIDTDLELAFSDFDKLFDDSLLSFPNEGIFSLKSNLPASFCAYLLLIDIFISSLSNESFYPEPIDA